MQQINVDPEETEETPEYTPRLGDWAHMAVKYRDGRLLNKSNPWYGEFWHYLQALHLTHSTEQMQLLLENVNAYIKECEGSGVPQPGKRTLAVLQAEYLEECDFSIATHDGMLGGQHDFVNILPSNQCEESWHKKLTKVLRGKMRGSTDFVLKESLPRLLLDDSLNLPRELNWVPSMISGKMVAKVYKCVFNVRNCMQMCANVTYLCGMFMNAAQALRYIEEEKRMIHTKDGKTNFYVLRFKSQYDKISKKLVKEYNLTLQGETPADVTARTQTTKSTLKELIKVCQSMHLVLYSEHAVDFPAPQLNPAKLCCTCKGFRMISVCSHCIAITALYIRGQYTTEYLTQLTDRLVEKPKRKSHRPRNTVGGAHIQPADSSDEDEVAEVPIEDLAQDLDDI